MQLFRTSEIFTGPMFRLLAVESVDRDHRQTDFGCHVYGRIEPIALVVCGPDGTYALDMEAKPADFGRLRQDVPGLEAMITRSDIT